MWPLLFFFIYISYLGTEVPYFHAISSLNSDLLSWIFENLWMVDFSRFPFPITTSDYLRREGEKSYPNPIPKLSFFLSMGREEWI